MTMRRVGLVPSTEHEDAQHLHRATVIVSRAPVDSERYGRAKLGSLAQDAGMARVIDVGGCVFWGKNHDQVARLMVRFPHAIVMVVLPNRPKKGGALAKAMNSLAASDIDVHVMIITAKAKTVVAWDLGSGRRCIKAPDIRRPAQQQSAPSTPRKPVPPRVHSAPRAGG